MSDYDFASYIFLVIPVFCLIVFIPISISLMRESAKEKKSDKALKHRMKEISAKDTGDCWGGF